MILYVDGGCSGNNNPDLEKRTMIAVVTDESGKALVQIDERGGSNNIAELLAVEAALRYCADRAIGEVLIYTDSRNNLSWALGSAPGKGINDRGRVLAVQDSIRELRGQVRMRLEWVGRDANKAGHYIERHHGL